MKKDSRMTEGSISRKIILFAIPLFLGNLFQQLYNTADSLIVGNFLGSNALAAVSSSGNLIFLMVGFINGIAMGAGVVVARYYGAKIKDCLQKAIHTTVAFGLVAGVVLTVMGMFLAPKILVLMGTPADVLPESIVYFRTYFAGSIGVVMYNIFVGILQSVGDSRHPLIYLIISSCINVVLDIFFIAGLGMGVGSAALATAISQYISAAILIIPYLTGKTQSRFSIGQVSHDSVVLKNIFFVGFPSMMRQGLQSISVMVLNLMAAAYGDAAIAAMSIASRVINFLFCVGLGIGQGFQPVCAFNYGAGIYTRVKKGVFFALAFGTCLLGVFAIIGFFYSERIVTWFRNDPEVISIGAYALKAQCLSLFVVPLSVCGNMLFQSVGKGGKATFLASLRGGICFIPLLLILTPLFGIRGIQLSQPIADVMSALITLPFILSFIRALPTDRPISSDAVSE